MSINFGDIGAGIVTVFLAITGIVGAASNSELPVTVEKPVEQITTVYTCSDGTKHKTLSEKESCEQKIKKKKEEEEKQRQEEENHRQLEAQQSQRNCNIKGNISYRTGEKIYHVPGQRYYNDTVIDTSRGERMFCSEEEAIAAGWRKSYV